MARNPRARFQFGWNQLYRTANSHIADVTSGASNLENSHPVQLLYPDAILNEINMPGSLSYIQDSPDSPDSNWVGKDLTVSELILNYEDVSAGGFASLLSGITPVAAGTGDGWVIRNVNSGLSSEFQFGTEKPAATFTDDTTFPKPGVPGLGNGWRFTMDGSGTIAASTWTFTVDYFAVTANAPGTTAQLKLRVFKSPNADGSSATEIGPGVIYSDLSGAINGTVKTLTASWAMPDTPVNDGSYIFITCALLIVVGGSGQNTGADFNLRVGPNSHLIYSQYNAEASSELSLSFPTPTKDLRNPQKFRVLARKKTKNTLNTTTLGLALYYNGTYIDFKPNTTITSQTGEIVEFTWDRSSVSGRDNVELRIYGYNFGTATILQVGAVEWYSTGWSAGALLVRTANSVVASITSATSRFRQLIRLVNSFVASVTSSSTRLAHLVRLANSYTATVTSVANRLALAKSRTVNSFVAAITSNASVHKVLARLSNSYVAAITAQASGHINKLRTAISIVADITGMGHRLAMAKSRAANSYVAAITSVSNKVASYIRLANAYSASITAYASHRISRLRSAISYVDGITSASHRLALIKNRIANSYVASITSSAARSMANKVRSSNSYSAIVSALSNRNPLSKTRLANTYVQAISSASNRLINRLRAANSWVDGITGHSNIIRNLHLTANSFVANITAFTSQANQNLRSVISYVSNITSRSNRNAIPYLRSVISHTGVFTGMGNRIITRLRSSNSYVAALTAYASGFRALLNLLRSANSYVASVTSKSERLNYQYRSIAGFVQQIMSLVSRFVANRRQANSSEEIVTSSATRVINKTRQANSHVERIMARAVMEGVEPNQYFPYFATVEVQEKVHATVEVQNKEHATLELITD